MAITATNGRSGALQLHGIPGGWNFEGKTGSNREREICHETGKRYMWEMGAATSSKCGCSMVPIKEVFFSGDAGTGANGHSNS